MLPQRLSEHFALSEFLRSQVAARAGRELVPPDEVVERLSSLCLDVLEPLRALLGRAVQVTSGWRPAWLNELVGGAPNSAHLTGRAADIVVPGMPARALGRFIRRHELPVDKCILEFDQWVHVQISPGPDVAPRGIFLTAARRDGVTQYLAGIA